MHKSIKTDNRWVLRDIDISIFYTLYFSCESIYFLSLIIDVLQTSMNIYHLCHYTIIINGIQVVHCKFISMDAIVIVAV